MQSKEDKLFAAQLSDRIRRCSDSYMITNSSFLDLRQRSMAEKQAAAECPSGYGFYGGYPDAERTIAVFLPDYIDASPEAYFAENQEENPLTVLRATLKKGSPELTHRDYLGSLMGLGIKRELTGDILVRPDGADIIVLKEMASYIMLNMEKAGRARLSFQELPVEELKLPEHHIKEMTVSVASLRLDNVISGVFNLARSKAAEAIAEGIVFVNGIAVEKKEKAVEEGDKLVFRGKGKAVVRTIGGRTAKDRIIIKADRYV